MTDHWAAVEADFQRTYGIDLRTFVDTAPARRMWALVTGLPPDAALWRSHAAGEREAEADRAAEAVQAMAISPAQFRAAFEAGEV